MYTVQYSTDGLQAGEYPCGQLWLSISISVPVINVKTGNKQE